MQSAKDSFYVMLRDRVAGINPGRTTVLRGVSRPGVLVEENELATTFSTTDAFWLRWTEVSVDVADALVRMRCEISYATDGLVGNGGMDRGQLLAGMDVELATALRREPQNVVKSAYSNNGVATLATNLFWTDPVFGKTSADGERMSRTTVVEVFAYQEAEEL